MLEVPSKLKTDYITCSLDVALIPLPNATPAQRAATPDANRVPRTDEYKYLIAMHRSADAADITKQYHTSFQAAMVGPTLHAARISIDPFAATPHPNAPADPVHLLGARIDSDDVSVGETKYLLDHLARHAYAQTPIWRRYDADLTPAEQRPDDQARVCAARAASRAAWLALASASSAATAAAVVAAERAYSGRCSAGVRSAS